MQRDNLEKPEIQCRMNELFNLVDNNFVRSDDRMHAYKLGRPALKVKLTQLVINFFWSSISSCDIFSPSPCRSEILTERQCMCYWRLAWSTRRG